jgi:hypothetical protein
MSHQFTARDLQTKNYRITKVIEPSHEPYEHVIPPLTWRFSIEGPGWNQAFVYAANSPSCGPNLIRSLQAAYDAGFCAGQVQARPGE